MPAPPQPNWEELLGIPKPKACNLKAACCSVATPSIPVAQLLQRAAEGEETARDFLNVFVAHASVEAAKAFYPEDPTHMDRVADMVTGQATKGSLNASDLVFYHCRYLGEDRRCQVYEDRPEFCRTYPASPMALTIKGCGYTAWKLACALKLKELGYEIVGLPVE
jgi:Fe-S-cluster containining protein